MQVKCLSIRQPYAGLILSGQKPVEFRCWPTKYRGPLFIASSQTPERDHEFFSPDLPRGAILGCVDLVDCLPLDDAGNILDAADDPDFVEFGFILEHPKTLIRPIPVKAVLRIFNVELDASQLKFGPKHPKLKRQT